MKCQVSPKITYQEEKIMKFKKFVCVAAFSASMSGLLLFSGCGKQQGQMEASAVSVTSYTVKSESVLLYTDLPGRVSPYLMAEIRPQVNGLIQKRLFVEGAEVKEGELLYEIDPAPYQAAVANAEAALAVAKAQRATALAAESRAKAGLANAEAAVQVASAGRDTSLAALEAAKTALTAAKAVLASSEANAEPLRLRAARFKELLESRAVSQQDFDDADSAQRQSEAGIVRSRALLDGAAAELVRAEAAVKVTDAEISRAQAGLLAAKAELEGATAGVQSAGAGIKSAEAMLESAQINLGYTKITAPIAGRIGRSNITVGALVTAHQPLALATIQRIDKVYVDVPQATNDYLQLSNRLGDGRLTHNGTQNVVKLKLEDGKPYPSEGTLQFRDVTVDPGTGSFILRMEFPNPQRVLLPGMYVRALVEEGVKENAILVPQQAIARDSKGQPSTMVIDGNSLAQSRSVEVDREHGNNWLISKGLNNGERVIVEGKQYINPGVKVTEVPSALAQNEKKTANQ